MPRLSSSRGRVAGVTRVLLVVMLMLLSPQLAWSAAAKYCGHEVGASHPGHHSHQHDAGGAVVADQASPGSQSPAGVADLDCGYCHGCVLQVLLTPPVSGIAPAAHSYTLLESAHTGIERLKEIERPKWQRAA